MVLVVSSSLMLGFAASVTAHGTPADPATTVWEAGGSNMGECSAFLGAMQKRDDVNHLIRTGAIPGVENPGQVYSVRAQQEESKPPAQECLRRH